MEIVLQMGNGMTGEFLRCADLSFLVFENHAHVGDTDSISVQTIVWPALTRKECVFSSPSPLLVLYKCRIAGVPIRIFFFFFFFQLSAPRFWNTPPRVWASILSSHHLIYLLTARVVGAPQMISQPVSSIFSLFSTALWDLANSRPVHSLMLSSHLFLCLPRLLAFASALSKKQNSRDLFHKQQRQTLRCKLFATCTSKTCYTINGSPSTSYGRVCVRSKVSSCRSYVSGRKIIYPHQALHRRKKISAT